MEYLSHTRSNPFEYGVSYTSHLSRGTSFPDITNRHNEIIRTNIDEFYKQPNTLRRTMTNLDKSSLISNANVTTRTGTILPLYETGDTHAGSIRKQLAELEGLHVPKWYTSNRTSLYTRYTVNDWSKNTQGLVGNSDRARTAAEQVRGESLRLGRDLDDKTNISQEDSTKKLGNRMDDIDYLKKELDNEIAAMIAETDQLIHAKKVAEKAYQELENPLHAAQQCLYNREKRAQIDLVHDTVEKELLREIETIKANQDVLNRLIQRAAEQIKKNRVAQYNCEKDSRDKYTAFRIDERAHGLKNHSAGITYHHGIQHVNNCNSTPETWARHTRMNIDLSKAEREASTKLREEIELGLKQAQNDTWKQWVTVNSALSDRIQEVMDARNKDQAHLNKILHEIYDTERNIEYLKKAILDKQDPLKVAQSRLYTTLDRPRMEACDDVPRNRLIKEVEEIESSIDQLEQQSRVSEAILQNLLVNKADLESDLAIKNNSIFIDREKCLGSRKSFAINDVARF